VVGLFSEIMKEAYLTGGNDAPETTAPAEQTAPVFLFESVLLTDEGKLKLIGHRFGGEAVDEFTITRNRAPHPDLLKELRRLTLHLALLTESVSDMQLYPPGIYHDTLLPPEMAARASLRDAVETGEAYVHPLLEPFRCLSITWKTKGVVLSGERKSRYRYNKSLVLKTPETMLLDGLDEDSLDEHDYPFFEQLRNALDSLRSECIAYMNGKYGEGGEQLDLFGKDPEPPTIEESLDRLDAALETAQKKRAARRTAVRGDSDVF
jgi:hypothetical protein